MIASMVSAMVVVTSLYLATVGLSMWLSMWLVWKALDVKE